jgi:hypothetical protein
MRKQRVLSQWLQLQWLILPILVAPLAIVIGMRRPNGAIIVSSVGALLVVAFQWYRSATNSLTDFPSGNNITDTVISQVGGFLLLTAWVLALAHAAQARRWRWFVVLIVAVFLSESVMILSQVLPNPCAYPPFDESNPLACLQPNQAFLLLLALGKALGPIFMLIYALRAPGHQRQLPDGLVVSSLRDGHVVDEDIVSTD